MRPCGRSTGDFSLLLHILFDDLFSRFSWLLKKAIAPAWTGMLCTFSWLFAERVSACSCTYQLFHVKLCPPPQLFSRLLSCPVFGFNAVVIAVTGVIGCGYYTCKSSQVIDRTTASRISVKKKRLSPEEAIKQHRNYMYSAVRKACGTEVHSKPERMQQHIADCKNADHADQSHTLHKQAGSIASESGSQPQKETPRDICSLTGAQSPLSKRPSGNTCWP